MSFDMHLVNRQRKKNIVLSKRVKKIWCPENMFSFKTFYLKHDSYYLREKQETKHMQD